MAGYKLTHEARRGLRDILRYSVEPSRSACARMVDGPWAEGEAFLAPTCDGTTDLRRKSPEDALSSN